MSLWVRRLLLLLLLASLRVSGAAAVDPLPAALVDLVRSSSISSIEDLRLLLFSDSLDQEEESSPALGGHRSPRSLNAQPAQQALCKVRTEVVEVTRDMVNRSNAHFMLWPPCVEVQRCSGCCNGNSLQCVPVLTHTRKLQVMKIQYVNQKPTYTKVVVSVVDHVECRPRKKSSRRGPLPGKDQHHRNQTIDQQQGQAKTHSKEVLHRQDELKKNQRVQPGELLDQHWSPRGDTFTSPEQEEEDAGHRYSLAGTGAGAGAGVSHGGETILHTPHWVHNASRLLETRDGSPSPLDVPGAVEGGAAEGVAESVSSSSSSSSSLHGTGEEARVDWGQQKSVNGHQDTRRGGAQAEWSSSRPQDDRSTGPKSQEQDLGALDEPQVRFGPTDASGGSRFRATKEPNPDPPGQGRRWGNETPEEERRSQQLEEERMELLLLHKRLDQEKELIRLQQLKQEEEREQQERGRAQQHDLHHKQHHHPQTTTQNIVTTTLATTRTPMTQARPRVRARPKQRRRRLRKNRKQISKAAMRAMLM